MSSRNIITIGSLVQKCLKKAYFLPQKPSSYSKGYRFLNDRKYWIYDCPPSPLYFDRFLSPHRHLPAAGDEIPVIMECVPQSYLQEHWKQWLPDFPPVVVKSLDEGLRDDVPVITTAALQSVPEHKQIIPPDLLYELQLKNTLVDFGVPFARYMAKNAISYPCAVKADMSVGGRGNWLVENEKELSATLRHITDVCHWKGGIVYQEFIPGVKEVPSFQFYLHKSGELFWVGTTTGGFSGLFAWTNGTVDWDKHEEYENLVYEEFTIPIKNYLHRRGFFGLVTFEVLMTDHGRYLVDVNPRIGGDTTHLLLARHMALDIGLRHSAIFCKHKNPNITAQELVKKADGSNNKGEGITVVLSVADAPKGSESYVSVFAKTPEDVQTLFYNLNN